MTVPLGAEMVGVVPFGNEPCFDPNVADFPAGADCTLMAEPGRFSLPFVNWPWCTITNNQTN